jgi:uncharacterized protein YqjF (DUF2071 family)
MSKIFLTARWENLVLVTYKVKPEVLGLFIPKGLEPDTINGDAFVSLVAFDFLDTKVKGIKIPFHVNFPEINLRAYVKHGAKRGVIFIREFVPRFFISLIANTVYNENYRSARMQSSIKKNGSIFLSHSMKFNGKEYNIGLQAENKPYMPAEGSTEHFFKEHEWGFGTNRAGKPLTYRVEHPFWEIYPVLKFEHNFDFGIIYGKKWESLNNDSPYNITFAKGSPIKVFSGELIK